MRVLIVVGKFCIWFFVVVYDGNVFMCESIYYLVVLFIWWGVFWWLCCEFIVEEILMFVGVEWFGVYVVLVWLNDFVLIEFEDESVGIKLWCSFIVVVCDCFVYCEWFWFSYIGSIFL